jgi:hypothetical protein
MHNNIYEIIEYLSLTNFDTQKESFTQFINKLHFVAVYLLQIY